MTAAFVFMHVVSPVMPSEDAAAPDSHPDQLRWNAKYARRFTPSFAPRQLSAEALSMELPDGPVADLACGLSGTALLAASYGRPVTAVDVSDVALGMLAAEARRRGLAHLITAVHADLAAWCPEPSSYVLVIATAAACWPGRLTPPRRGPRTPACGPNGAWLPASPRRCSRRISPSSTSTTKT
jgi:SAM-dependent methyltransferase